MRVLVKKRRTLPLPRLLSAGAALLVLLLPRGGLVVVVGGVVLLPNTPVCICKRSGVNSGQALLNLMFVV